MLRWIAAAALAATSLPAAAQSMEPGQWEFHSVLTTPGMGQPRTTVMKQCVTPADAKDPTRFTAGKQAEGCTVTPGEHSAQHFTWTVSCPKQGMTGTGEAKVGASAIDSEMRITIDVGGQKMRMSNHVTGRRLGACKAGG